MKRTPYNGNVNGDCKKATRGILVDGDITVHQTLQSQSITEELRSFVSSHLISSIMAFILITLMMSNPSGNEKRLP